MEKVKVKVENVIIFIQLSNGKIHQVLSPLENKRQAIHLIAELDGTLKVKEIPETFEIEQHGK